MASVGITSALTVAAVSLAGLTEAGQTRNREALSNATIQHLPPSEYVHQWWVHPSGCEYSRAGRPGETVWYVIINSVGKKKCRPLIVQQAMDDAYEDLVPTN